MSEAHTRMQDATGWRESLAARVLAVLEEGVEGDGRSFDDLALEVFAYQYEYNAVYRAYCDASGASPSSVAAWDEIPAYPTDAFKNEVVASFETEKAVQANLTSGTTRPSQRGRIFRDETGRTLVFAANRIMTGSYLFPDFEQGRRCRILLMTPSVEMAPTMGMAIGMDQTRRHFGTEDSVFLVKRSGVDVKRLVAALRTSEATGVPIAMIGATSAFVYFLKSCRERGMRFRLPAGSRVCDGGGYRGRFGVVTRDDYYGFVYEILDVPADHCVNTLGLAETATNYFDDTLRTRVLGSPAGPRRKVSPPWTRTQAYDIETRRPCPPGRIGLLRHYDLCNLPTVIGVQSDNLGIMDETGGFEIIGRAKVVEGKVQELPSEATVGPMGDNRVFRLLEAYVNFSIDLKMGRIESGAEKADYLAVRREADAAQGIGGGDPTASCPVAVEEIVAGADDPEARKRAEAALATFQEDPGTRGEANGDEPEGDAPEAGEAR